MEFSDSELPNQVRYTKSLIKFCSDHGYNTNSDYFEAIKSCLSELENKRVDKAYMIYKKIPIGGNGCFNDWWPPAVFEHEDENYTWTVFECLVFGWRTQMEMSVKYIKGVRLD